MDITSLYLVRHGETDNPRGVLLGDLFARGYTNETQEDIAQRMINVVNECLAQHRGQTVAIVGHRDPLTILRYRLQHPDGQIPPMRDLYYQFGLDTAGYCVLIPLLRWFATEQVAIAA